MKETYVKPAICIESFALTQSIARPCGDNHTGSLGESNHYGPTTCAWVIGDLALFTATTAKCDYPMDEDEEIEGICYNNPDGGQQVFSST